MKHQNGAAILKDFYRLASQTNALSVPGGTRTTRNTQLGPALHRVARPTFAGTGMTKQP